MAGEDPSEGKVELIPRGIDISCAEQSTYNPIRHHGMGVTTSGVAASFEKMIQALGR